MTKRTAKRVLARPAPVYQRIRDILESARAAVARSVNTTQVVANWLIGREIVEEEQSGAGRAEYGQELLKILSAQLNRQYGRGFSVSALQYMRSFFLVYPNLLEKQHALRVEFRCKNPKRQIQHAVRAESTRASSDGPIAPSRQSPRSDQADDWRPGWLNAGLSWTHYRTLLRVELADARSFYEIEAVQNNWSARERERQINSLLYERLARSRDKRGLMRLAAKGQAIARSSDVFKDPLVIEFLGLPESPRLVETGLEEALIGNLQAFLLELGKGFAFVARPPDRPAGADAREVTATTSVDRAVFQSHSPTH